MHVELRVTQIVLAVAVAVLAVGILLGRYVVSSGRPSGRKIELPNGQGTLFLSDKQARVFKQRSDGAQAQTNVRASIPALEAWYADHGTYAGATLDAAEPVATGCY